MTRRHALKNHMVAFLGEFVGTFMFLFISFAGTETANIVVQKSNETLTSLIYVCLVFGLSLLVNVWLFFRISGGLFNPAVTLSLCLVGVVPPLRSVFIFVAQILAGIAAAGLAEGLVPESDLLFAVSLSAGTSLVRGLFLETFCTAQLIFAILMLAAEKTKATFLAPIGIGLSLFAAMLVSVNWTGGSLNPARAFGPAVVKGYFPGSHWIYWLGPVLGALLASGFYKLMKVLNYEEVNGDQDKSAYEEKVMPKEQKDDDEDVEKGRRRSNSHQSSNTNHRNGSMRNGDVQNGYRSGGRSQGASPNRQHHRNSGGEYPVQYQQPNHPAPPPNGPLDRADRNSRAFAPQPQSLQYREDLQGRRDAADEGYLPSQPTTSNGEPYVQDTDAQIRGVRKSSQRRHQRMSSGDRR